METLPRLLIWLSLRRQLLPWRRELVLQHQYAYAREHGSDCSCVYYILSFLRVWFWFGVLDWLALSATPNWVGFCIIALLGTGILYEDNSCFVLL
jgi:hypothetical protein